MNKKRVRSVYKIFLVFLLAVLLVGCGADKTIVGKWAGSEMGLTTVIEFTKNGHMSMSAAGLLSVSGSYSLEGEYIVFKPDDENKSSGRMSFALDRDTLILDGKTYIRQ